VEGCLVFVKHLVQEHLREVSNGPAITTCRDYTIVDENMRIEKIYSFGARTKTTD